MQTSNNRFTSKSAAGDIEDGVQNNRTTGD
jgi:hypothetical protein